MDKEYLDESFAQRGGKKVSMEEHQFIANCLQCGLTMRDLENYYYIDIAKIVLCNSRQYSKKRVATQADWDRLAGGK